MGDIRNPSAPPPTGAPAARTTDDTQADDAQATGGAQAEAPPPSSPGAKLGHTSVDRKVINTQVDAIFEQAGLVRGSDGTLEVKDTAKVKPVSLTDFEQIAGETELQAPAPPKVEFTEAMRMGAGTFAANMDKVMDDILLLRKTEQPTAKPESTASSSGGAPSSSSEPAVSASAGTATSTTSTSAGLSETKTAAQTTNVQSPTEKTSDPSKTKSLWKLAEEIRQSPGAQQYRANMASNEPTGTYQEELFRRISELTADVLLAAFLKLNIMDPNNSVDTHQKLYALMSRLRQRALDDAKQQAKVAAELREEAERDADNAAYVNEVVSTIRTIVCIVALICMFIPGVNVIVAIVAAVICLACTIVQAQAQRDATVAACDAAEAGAMVQRAQLMADRCQEQLEEEAEIIKMILESKNRMVEAVIRMLNAMFGAAQKLMSAGMAKG